MDILKKHLEEQGLLNELNEEEIEANAAKTIDEAVEFAEKSPLEPIDEIEKFVYSPIKEASNG